MDVTFDNPAALYGLWLAAIVAVVGVVALWRQRRAARRFADEALAEHILPARSSARAGLRIGLTAAAIVALAIALAGPRWGERAAPVFRRDVETVVLLDVSRSMRAQDVVPSRLERAKLAISEDLVPALGGGRVRLVTFAGEARTLCPLTFDYDALRRALRDAGPGSVRGGGSLVGDGIRAAGALFTDSIDTHRLVVLLTDGEDQGSFPVDAAAALWKDHGAALLVVGLGDAGRGQPIPLGDGKFLEIGGQIVRSRADLKLLARVAAATPASLFLPAATGDFDLGAAYRQAVRGARLREEAGQAAQVQPSRMHWFAAVALVLVLGNVLLPMWPRRAAPGRAERRAARGRSWRGAVRGRADRWAPVVGAVVLLLGIGAGVPGSVREWMARGNANYAAGEFRAALNAYERAAEGDGAAWPEVEFNQALAHYKLGETEAARQLWQRVQSSGDVRFEARAVYNLGNCDYAAALGALKRADMTAAVQRANAARARYCDALRLDGMLGEARVNLELTNQLLGRIEEAERQGACDKPSESGGGGGEGEAAGESRDAGGKESASDASSESDRDEEGARGNASGEKGGKPGMEPRRQDVDSAQATGGPRPSDADREAGTENAAEPTDELAKRGDEKPAGQEEAGDGRTFTAAELRVRMTPAEAERLLQRLRDAQQERVARQREREQEAEYEALHAPGTASY